MALYLPFSRSMQYFVVRTEILLLLHSDAKPTLCFFSAVHQVFTKLITWKNLSVAMVTQQRPSHLLNCLIGA